MERRRLTRWVRVGLVALAIAGATALPMVDPASAGSYKATTRVGGWCSRCV